MHAHAHAVPIRLAPMTLRSGALSMASPCAGASLAEYDLGPIELGKARRTGTVAESVDGEAGQNGAAAAPAVASDSLASVSSDEGDASGLAAAALAAQAAPAIPQINRRCKRRRRELLEAAA